MSFEQQRANAARAAENTTDRPEDELARGQSGDGEQRSDERIGQVEQRFEQRLQELEERLQESELEQPAEQDVSDLRQERADRVRGQVVRTMASDATGTTDATALVEIPQITLDELETELQARAGIEHLSLHVKGLQAGLFVTANLDNILALAGKPRARKSPDIDASPSGHRQAEVRREVPDRKDERGDDDGGSGPSLPSFGDAGRRVLSAVKDSGPAGPAAAIGLAGGALLASRGGKAQDVLPGRGSSLPRLPGRSRGPKDATKKLGERIRDEVVGEVKRHLS